MFRIINAPLATAILASGLTFGTSAHAEEATVIDLTQTGCQFVESENGVNHGYAPKSAEDCSRINAENGAERLASAEVLTLKPGTYVFRVTNQYVPYQLGFWLREDDYEDSSAIAKLSKTSVSGGGLTLGKTRDYEVTLEPGEYLYSCPLNPTPNYRLVVEG